jgi:hypothetical protein
MQGHTSPGKRAGKYQAAHLLNAKVQLYPWPVFGLRGVNLFGSALRGDFPVFTSVLMPRSFPNTAARQFRSLTGFPIADWVITE